MDHMTRRQLAAAGYCRLADPNRSDPVAFLLDARSALDANRAGHAASQHQVVVRGIDDRIDPRLGQITLPECHLRAPFTGHRASSLWLVSDGEQPSKKRDPSLMLRPHKSRNSR